MASGQDGLVLAAVALLGADVADAAVAVIDVVPTYEFSCPGPGCVFRSIVTARFGIVTAEFGNVTDRFGDVTGGVLKAA